MKQLSPNYRTDDLAELDADTRAYLDEHYLASLENLDHANPKLLVVFSGGSATGKSTLSARIRDELGGLVLENDAVKRHLLKLRPNLTRDELNRTTWLYTMGLYARLDQVTSNGLVVRDGVIDWYYDRILPVFHDAGYQTFVIGYDITREKSIDLIRKRGDTPTTSAERLIELLDDVAIHIRRFRQHYTPDITLTDDNMYDHDAVIAAIRDRLSTLG